MLESVEGDDRPDHRAVLPDRQQGVIRAGGIIGAALSPVVAEEVLIEEDRRRGNFFQDALRPGRRSRLIALCRTVFPGPRRRPSSAGELWTQKSAADRVMTMAKSRRDGRFLPLFGRGCKGESPDFPTARILLMEMKGGTAEMVLGSWQDLPQKG